ncbi:DNA-(apurinic or apyrimidinic site) lyase 2 [Osmerus mordax]|uniref:DNA-(apurinic or apyrimidinic site) lyase 2 n=1 Tax=Osmerus mordax TaxID=8014 RepID=UPI0035100530
MRIVTWNINGIRTLKGGIKKALDSLDADIVCVQETKVTRDLLDERTAIVEGYNSYFSFSRGRSGYSGVATYCKDSASPFSAEEGLTGLLNTSHEGAVGSYGNQREFSSEELQLLDNEGRAVITQHKVMFENQPQTLTVVNVYCPRADPEKPERKQFKLQFYKLLQHRAEAILKDGSHVIVLGDVNTAHRPVDHCDPDDINDFEGNPGRKWLNGFLLNDGEEDDVEGDDNSCENKTGRFVDTFRHFQPKRTNAFTCWSTLTGARQTNYGTRIDYIFADSLLVKGQFVAADIMPEMEGSDHCPVWGHLSCSLLPSSKLPPLCTRHLPEFAGKQQKLSRFLVKVEKQAAKETSRDQAPLPSSQEAGETQENLIPQGSGNRCGMKRTLTEESGLSKGKKSKTVKAPLKAPSKPQGSLLAFFKPKSTQVVLPMQASVSQCIKNSEKTEVREGQATGPDGPSVNSMDPEGAQSVCLGKRDPPPFSTPQDTVDRQKQGPDKPLTSASTVEPCVKGAPLGFWKTVLHGPPQPPPCKTHREPCVLRTVKKAGPNMGRQFFVCARPQGHTSNPEARCNFFAWVDKGK